MRVIVAAFTSICLGTAAADEFTLTNASNLQTAGVVGATFVGNLIGDWDAESNPGGTQTRPGVWGGSGNNPIPLEMDLAVNFNFQSVPAGSLDLELNPKTSTATISDFQCDILPEEIASAALTVTVLYETFRTFAPDSLFVGGIPIEIPMGEATITAASLTQAAIGIGVATPVDGQDGAHDVIVAVPAMLDLLISTEATSDIPLQFPIVISLHGVHQSGVTQDTFIPMLSVAIDETGDLPAEPLPTIPLELPTNLPPGSIANVLLTLIPSTASVSSTTDGTLDTVHEHGMPGDVNGDGVVNTNDLLAVLAAWGPCQECSEDLNQDGFVGVDDLLMLIAAWT